jgi:hypothetical protein
MGVLKILRTGERLTDQPETDRLILVHDQAAVRPLQ